MNFSVIVFFSFFFCLIIIRVQICHGVFHFLVCYKTVAFKCWNVRISNPPAGIGDGWYCLENTKPSTFLFSSFKKKNMCLEISPGTSHTVFSRGGMSTIALIAQQYGSIFFDSLSVSIFTVRKSACLALLHAKFL